MLAGIVALEFSCMDCVNETLHQVNIQWICVKVVAWPAVSGNWKNAWKRNSFQWVYTRGSTTRRESNQRTNWTGQQSLDVVNWL